MKFTCVSETDPRYERPRVNVKVEWGSTFTYTGDLPYVVSIFFTRLWNLRKYAGRNYATVETHLKSISLGCKIPWRVRAGSHEQNKHKYIWWWGKKWKIPLPDVDAYACVHKYKPRQREPKLKQSFRQVRMPAILDKLKGKPWPPPPPQIKDGKMARFCSSRSLILDLGGGGWGFAVPFYFVQDWGCSARVYITVLALPFGSLV